ncbi:MAG: DUF4190 domain-containing protein [Ruminococcus sp.]|uniref:DUF4190 domain-containing protein n=1 Tax=Ruminococcus flavefaciens TaxID=1265 RepID=UPI0026EFE5C6|nr:DUF4190 domain-containing protein [Ruminococcus flavefaciens]MBR0512244.1 DUF4190 domain-containing protein [Ruminococcus sp.]
MDNNYNNNQNDYQNNGQVNADQYAQPAFDPYSNSMDQTPKSNGMAIASLVLGIISIVICCTTWPGGILGILSVIFGAVSIKKNGKNGLAVAGLVCGIIGTLLGFGYMIVILAKGEALMSWAEKAAENANKAAIFFKK